MHLESVDRESMRLYSFCGHWIQDSEDTEIHAPWVVSSLELTLSLALHPLHSVPVSHQRYGIIIIQWTTELIAATAELLDPCSGSVLNACRCLNPMDYKRPDLRKGYWSVQFKKNQKQIQTQTQDTQTHTYTRARARAHARAHTHTLARYREFTNDTHVFSLSENG